MGSMGLFSRQPGGDRAPVPLVCQVVPCASDVPRDREKPAEHRTIKLYIMLI